VLLLLLVLELIPLLLSLHIRPLAPQLLLLLHLPWSLTPLQQQQQLLHHDRQLLLLLLRTPLQLPTAAQKHPLAKPPEETSSCSCTDQASTELQWWLHAHCRPHCC
jgi:hypothetical protein